MVYKSTNPGFSNKNKYICYNVNCPPINNCGNNCGINNQYSNNLLTQQYYQNVNNTGYTTDYYGNVINNNNSQINFNDAPPHLLYNFPNYNGCSNTDVNQVELNNPNHSLGINNQFYSMYDLIDYIKVNNGNK